jgi:hypothetical protein
VFRLTSFSCHNLASNHAIPLLSFLEHHSVYTAFLLQETFIFVYSVNETFSERVEKEYSTTAVAAANITTTTTTTTSYFCCCCAATTTTTNNNVTERVMGVVM